MIDVYESHPPPPMAAPPIPRDAFLFECAWEICNQVGGIYQVLRSKAQFMMERWDDAYCLIGPYIPEQASLDFEPAVPEGWLATLIEKAAGRGLTVHYGTWLITGKPQALLLDFRVPREVLNRQKHEVWEEFGIETPADSDLVDNTVAFASAVTLLLEVACELRPGLRTLAHFHEWQTGLAIPMIRGKNLPLATGFTTHATMLGRYIASSRDDLYQRLTSLDSAAEAAHFGITSQHQIERASALGATVFTTVSPITGEECQYLLGRKPDVITPNGINVERYDVGHDFQTLHSQYKSGIRRFVMGHFFHSYSFDLDNTLHFFTSGRFEPHNKGFDLCLEAMARLNTELKAANLGVTIVFFIVTAQPVRSVNPYALADRGVLEELHSVSEQIAKGISEQLFLRGASGEQCSLDDLADEYWTLRFRRTQYAMRSHRLPSSVTHVLQNEADDPILDQIKQLGLTNSKDDRVKVVYHPQFINSVNPLWRMEYEQFVRGCHLGLFPSSYEPWGYTPLECVCMGVPAITSDLSGFGRYLSDVHPDHDRHGITVLGRRDQDYYSSATELSKRLLAFCRLSRRQRITLRNAVEHHSHSFSWSRLGVAYHQAHDMALARFY